VLPLIALLAGSIMVRPMFQIRYLVPGLAMIALLVARLLESFGSKVRNLAVAGITLVLLVLVPIKEITYEPWRDITALIAAQSPSNQPVFFESGFLFFDQPDSVANGGFPSGYYRAPFDYYFRAANPRIAVPGWDPVAAKQIIAQRASATGGGWLISWKDAPNARVELPGPSAFHITQVVDAHLVAVYRMEPVLPVQH
jgi:hypothetical protein